jgi:hypothetical protein
MGRGSSGAPRVNNASAGGGSSGGGGGGSVEATDAALRGRSGLISEKRMTNDEKQSLHWYQSAGHDRINAELRGSAKIRDQYTFDRTVGNIDGIMKRSKLNRDVTVYRGVLRETDHAQAEIARMKPGAIIRDRGYVSTTINPAVAKRFGSDDVHIRIRVPKGTHAIYMPKARPLSMVSRGKHNEYELLLARNLNYRVVSRRKHGNQIRITLEVVP